MALWTYRVEYRAGLGRKAPVRRVVIGRHGAMAPEEARKAAAKILARTRLGDDPAGEHARARQMPTLTDFATEFLRQASEIATNQPEQARLRPSTIRNYEVYFRKYLKPAFGTMKIDKIAKADIVRLHNKLGETRPITANRVVEFVGTLWRAATDQGHVTAEENPTRGLRAFKEKKRERYLSVEELSRLGEALRKAETTGIPWQYDAAAPGSKHLPSSEADRAQVLDPSAVAALRCLMFSGARLREVLHARWDDLDLQRGLLRVYGKTGLRYIVLPSPALEIIRSLDRVGPYLFPGRDPDRPRHDLNRPWRAISRFAELSDVRIHDLRHTFGATGASAGFSLPIVGKLLGHTQASSTARYGHLRDDPLRRAAEHTAGEIAAALNGI